MDVSTVLAYAADGVKVFPLHDVESGACSCGEADCGSPGKHPRTLHGLKDATLDRDQIIAWWAKWPHANVGLAMGGHLAVLDIDGDEGEKSLERLLGDRGIDELISTYEVKTPKGSHLYFTIPANAKITNKAFGPEYPKLDVRGEGGYVVGPPSKGLLGPYTVTSAVPPAEWPAALLPPSAPQAVLTDSGETTCRRAENALERAKAKLLELEPAAQGRSGHNRLLRACSEAFRFGLTSEEVFDAIVETYNPRCVPPWEPAEFWQIEHKVEEARAKSDLARDSVYLTDAVGRGLERVRAQRRERRTAEALGEIEPVEIADDVAFKLLAKKTANVLMDAAMAAIIKGQAFDPSMIPKVARALFTRTKGGFGAERGLEILQASLIATIKAEAELDTNTFEGASEEEVIAYVREEITAARAEYDKRQAAKDAKAATLSNRYAYLVPLERFFYKHGDVWDMNSPVSKDGVTNALLYEGFTMDEIKDALAAGAYLRAHGVDCIPDGEVVEERDGQAFLNCYIPPKLVPKDGQCPSVERLLLMLTGGDTEGVRWLKNWIAAKVQRPSVRGIVAPVLYSKHTGTGKTTLGKIIRTIIGVENCAEIGQGQLSSSFNSYFAKSLFVVANEIFTSDKQQDQANRLKALITDETIPVNTKGVKEYPITNRTSWLITSNNKTPVRLEGETDRRYSVFNSAVPTPEYKEFLAGLFGPDRDFTPEALEEVAAFAAQLLAMDVDQAMAARPYESEARSELADVTRPVEDEFLQECFDVGPAAVVAEYPPDFWKDMIPRKDTWNFGAEGISQKILGGSLQTYCKRQGKFAVTTKRLTHAAKELGIKIGRLGYSTRPWVYRGWPEPTLDVEPQKPNARLLPMQRPVQNVGLPVASPAESNNGSVQNVDKTPEIPIDFSRGIGTSGVSGGRPP